MRSLDPVEASLKRSHLLPRVSVDVYTLYTSLAATLEQSHKLRLDPLTPISGRLRAYAQIPNLLGRQVLGAHQPVECGQRHGDHILVLAAPTVAFHQTFEAAADCGSF